MNSFAQTILGAAAIGIGASALMDLWNLFLKHAFGIPSLNYCFLGRWICSMPGGTFRHASIAASPSKKWECAIGWAAHYTIGISLAYFFVVVVGDDWWREPSLWPALVYGVATVVFPFFVMQPALGLGVASSKAANPTQARVKSLMTHLIFGWGLYLCALAYFSLSFS